MVTLFRQQGLAFAVMLAVALLAAANWLLSPEEASQWLRAMLVLPLLWLGLTLWHRWTLRSLRERHVDDEAAVTRYFGSTLSLLIVAFGIWRIAALSLEIWGRTGGQGADVELERRVLGIATGMFLIFIGNALPKILTPFSMLPPDLAARVTTARRFIGTTWFMLGLTTLLAFMVAPLGMAATLSWWTLGAGGGAMVGGIVWMNATPLRRGR